MNSAAWKEPDRRKLLQIKTFDVWRTFQYGGVSRLMLPWVAPYQLTDFVCDIIKDPSIELEMHDTPQTADTVVMTPADFGFTRKVVSHVEMLRLFDVNFLLNWSRMNSKRLPRGKVVTLLPYEAGPWIRKAYEDQPREREQRAQDEEYQDEVLWMPTADFGRIGIRQRRGDVLFFCLALTHVKHKLLTGRHRWQKRLEAFEFRNGSSQLRWTLESKLLYQLAPRKSVKPISPKFRFPSPDLVSVA